MKYTKEILEDAVAKNTSMAGVLRYLGLKPSGGMQHHLSKRIEEFGIDKSHFLGQGWLRGKTSNTRLSPEKILVVMPSGSPRQKNNMLRRALIESGVEYRCATCKISEWMGKDITLDVDHINGDWCDNRKENLRFLCPNCHRQTDNFAGKANKQA